MRRFSRAFLALVLTAVAAAASAQPPARAIPPTIEAPVTSEDVLTAQGERVSADITPLSYDVTVTPDATSLSTAGLVIAEFDTHQPMSVIRLNAYRMNFGTVRLDGTDSPPQVAIDAPAQTVSFDFGRTIAPGRHRLSIAFVSEIATTAYGLFMVDYKDPDGQPARLLASQFESTAAHRFMPCWDEPAAKATFTLHVTAPKAQMVVSNTQSVRTTDLAGDLQRVDFATTPRMAPYLLFLSIGDYERVHRAVDGIDVGVVVRRGETAKGLYALDAAAQVLPYYNAYFGMPYPMTKIDLLAAPVTSLGFVAMENWGAMFFMESALLYEEGKPDEMRRRFVFDTIAHEMAHQWFGDLVTMRDWNELWLNEGLASWMASKASEALHPDWETWAQQLDGRERAMALDARPDAPPIILPPGQGDGLATPATITYLKGEAVVRMIEAWLGPDAFRDGVRRYMLVHRYGNTTSDDLWAALGDTTGADIGSFARGFTDQPGIPLISVETQADGLKLSQTRYGLTSAARGPGRWIAPLKISRPGGTTITRQVTGGAPVSIYWSGAAAVNAGQAAYARIDYDAASLDALRRAFPSLKPVDQLGLLNDQWALYRSGDRPLSQYLSLLRRIPADASPSTWLRVTKVLKAIDILLDGSQAEAYHAAVQALLAPMALRLGAPRPTESPATTALRADIDLLVALENSLANRVLTPGQIAARDQILPDVVAWSAAR